MPDSSLEASREHLRKISSFIKELQVRFGDQLLDSVTTSIGIAQAPGHGLTEDEVLRSADRAMYAAKQAGRDCIVVYHNDHLNETG